MSARQAHTRPDNEDTEIHDLIKGYRARINAALKLHTPVKQWMGDAVHCRICPGGVWPCPTWKALNGE